MNYSPVFWEGFIDGALHLLFIELLIVMVIA